MHLMVKSMILQYGDLVQMYLVAGGLLTMNFQCIHIFLIYLVGY